MSYLHLNTCANAHRNSCRLECACNEKINTYVIFYDQRQQKTSKFCIGKGVQSLYANQGKCARLTKGLGRNKEVTMKRIAIIGGGVAGLSAAVYALRANAEVTMFEQYGLGGLLTTIDKVENCPSYISVEGWQLAQNFASHAKSLGLKPTRERVVSLTKQGKAFVVETDKNRYEFPAVVVATGTSHNKLGFEADWVGKGVSYCATCDGNFFRGKRVAVVGGGGQAVREATYLADVVAEVVVVCPSDKLTAEDTAVSELTAKSNVSVLYNASVSAIVGDDVVEGIDLYADGTTQRLDVVAMFVAVGATPVTEFVHIDGVKDGKGYLMVDAKCQTAVDGLFAAGDVTDGPLKQVVTAAADGAKAAVFATAYAAKSSMGE